MIKSLQDVQFHMLMRRLYIAKKNHLKMNNGIAVNLYFALLLSSFLFGSVALADNKTGSSSDVTIVEVESKIKEVENSSSLSDDEKSSLIPLYKQTINLKQREQEFQNSYALFESAMANAQDQTDKVYAILSTRKKNENKVNTRDYSSLSTTELEQVLIDKKENLASVKMKLYDIDNKLSDELARPATARVRLIEASSRLNILEKLISDIAHKVKLNELKEANLWLLQSEYAALSAEIRSLKKELSSQPLRVGLLNANKELSSFDLAQAEAEIEHLENLNSSLQLSLAQMAMRESEQLKRKTESSHIVVKNLASDNVSLSRSISQSAAKLDAITEKNIATTKEIERLQKEFSSTQKQLEIAGFSQTLGYVLLERKRKLMRPSSLQTEIDHLKDDITSTSLLRLQSEDDLNKLNDSDAYIAEMTTNLSAEVIKTIQPELKDLIGARKELLQHLINIEQSLIISMGEVEATKQSLYLLLLQYYQLLDERLLWIRNAETVKFKLIKAIPDELAYFFAPADWKKFYSSITFKTQDLILMVFCFGVLLFTVLRKSWLVNNIIGTSRNINKVSMDKYSETVKALLYTIMLTVPWTLCFIVSGHIVQTSLAENTLAKVVGEGLIVNGQLLFFLLLLHYLCIKKGLAEAHFKWSEARLMSIRNVIPKFIISFLPVTFFAILVGTTVVYNHNSGLRLVVFIVLQITLSYFTYKLTKPANNTTNTATGTKQSLKGRWSLLFRIAGIIIPLALIMLALVGYLYGAATLTWLLVYSLWFLLLMVIFHQMLMRWLVLTNRRLALQAALEKRALARKQQEDLLDDARPIETNMQVDEPKLDLVAVSRESQQLLNAIVALMFIFGLGFIWSGVLPALSIVDTVTLWHRLVIVGGVETLAPVTLGDGFFAILLLVLATLAARKLPAFLEIAILQKLAMDTGSRYAVKSLINYVIIAITFIWITNIIGVSWSHLQWLVAALGVGIGFGLQEIIANFISGLIILFERPIRVGDIVTIGETDGVVTRIQIRATTIRGWDRKELLVPNKEFITGRLLNWTLSDKTTRVMFSLGVAYGSDVELAMKLIEDACVENEKVLADPAPFITFDSFGDNSLAITVRCYLDSTDYRVHVASELHLVINRKLNDAGIVISFPQRDVHLDTSSPLDIRLHTA